MIFVFKNGTTMITYQLVIATVTVQLESCLWSLAYLKAWLHGPSDARGDVLDCTPLSICRFKVSELSGLAYVECLLIRFLYVLSMRARALWSHWLCSCTNVVEPACVQRKLGHIKTIQD